MDYRHAITPLLRRVIAFLGLFVVVSGLGGSQIIGAGLVEVGGFWIYGSLGKAFIFGLIAFGLLAYHNAAKKPVLVLKPWDYRLLGWLILAAVFFVTAWLNIGNMVAGQRTSLVLLEAHGGLALCVAATVLACFGPTNIRLIWQRYRREIWQAILLAVVFYGFLQIVYGLWQVLATAVLQSVGWLLGLSGLQVQVLPPHTLLLDKFGVTVAQYCSGVESIALFTGLYVVVGLLERERLRFGRYVGLFLPALLGLFACNIARVYGLTMAGYHLSPQIAFSLFHTYAGVVFFVGYSALFWAIFYKYLVASGPKAETLS